VLKPGIDQEDQEDVELCPDAPKQVANSYATKANKTQHMPRTHIKPNVQIPPKVVGSLGALDVVLGP